MVLIEISVQGFVYDDPKMYWCTPLSGTLRHRWMTLRYSSPALILWSILFACFTAAVLRCIRQEIRAYSSLIECAELTHNPKKYRYHGLEFSEWLPARKQERREIPPLRKRSECSISEFLAMILTLSSLYSGVFHWIVEDVHLEMSVPFTKCRCQSRSVEAARSLLNALRPEGLNLLEE